MCTNVRTLLAPSRLFVEAHGEIGDSFLRNLKRWFTPPDPSTNYELGLDAYHKGTTTWFTEGNIFHEWDSNGSLLWIHGKRASFHRSVYLSLISPAIFIAGSGKSILWSAISMLLYHTVAYALDQHCDHPTYPFTVR